MALRLGASVLRDAGLSGSRLPQTYGMTRCFAAALSTASAPKQKPSVPTTSSAPAQKSAATNAPTLESIAARSKEVVALRTYKPRTPGLRHLKRVINDHLWVGRPHLSLTFPKVGHGKGGRNNTGRVTVRHRGGGHRRRIRTVDYYRWDAGAHIVDRIEYDPNRSAHIALVTAKKTRKKSYIIAPDGLEAGDVVHSYRSGIPRPILDTMGGIIDLGVLASKTCFRGNCLPLRLIPTGTLIHNISIRAKGPAILCRSAGTYGVIMSKGEQTKEDGTTEVTGGVIAVRLQSGEVRSVSKDACATVGMVSNPHHHLEQLGKAGRSRWLNIRPSVRGVAMNRNDHPHGGGRGKSKSNRHPTSPWGTPAKGGFKTRKKDKPWHHLITPRPRGSLKKRQGKEDRQEKGKK